MANPFDFPKSKIPVPESPFLSSSRVSGFLSELSDQVFFDDPDTQPPPLDSFRPIEKPPYSSSRQLESPSYVPARPVEKPSYTGSKPSYGSSRPGEKPPYSTSRALDSPSYGASRTLDSPSFGTSRHLDSPSYGTSRPLDSPSYGTSRPLETSHYGTSRTLEKPPYSTSRPVDLPSYDPSRPRDLPPYETPRPRDLPQYGTSIPRDLPGYGSASRDLSPYGNPRPRDLPPNQGTSRPLEVPSYGYARPGLLDDLELDSYLAAPSSHAIGRPAAPRARHERPSNLPISDRTPSALVEQKLEELLGPKVDSLLDELGLPPVSHKTSRSMDHLDLAVAEVEAPYSLSPDSSRRYPFDRISERMDRKKSSSQSRLNGDTSPHRPLSRASPPIHAPPSRAAPPKKQPPPEKVKAKPMGKSDAKSTVSKVEKKPVKAVSKSTENIQSLPKEASTAAVKGVSKANLTVGGKDSPQPPTVVVTPGSAQGPADDKKPKAKTATEPAKKATAEGGKAEASKPEAAVKTEALKQQKGAPAQKRQKTSTLALKSDAGGEAQKKTSGRSTPTPTAGPSSKADAQAKGAAGKGVEKKAGAAKEAAGSGDGKKPEAEAAAAAVAGTAAAGTKQDPVDKEKEKADELEREKHKELVQRVLTMCQKSDWHAVEQTLRYLEKAIAVGISDDPKPLATVADELTGWTPLMYAVKDNRIPLADKMLDLGCDVNARNKESMTPLHIAALFGRDDTVKFLIFKRADVVAVTEGKKQTAIHLACTRGTGNATSILKILLGVSPKDARLQKDGDGNIPLFISLNAGSRSQCHELLQHNAHEQMRVKAGPRMDTALHMAIRRRDLETARIFVDCGANVDAKNGDGQTAMHIAAAEGEENLLKFFYLCKANPNVPDKEDRTPIHIAAQHGHTAIIELLAEKFKVSVFERTKDGSTLMHIASLHGHPDTAMALFRKGVPLQMPNKGGARSLHIAARHGHAAMISKLLEKGEKVDATTNDNYTALHIAVESGRPSVVETLLGFGAQVHIKGGKAQETPLHIAARVNEGDKCAQMLLKSGADPNITMENGETPLHVAARAGRLRIIRLLLNDGADPIHKSKDGETPLHLACRFGHLRVVTELLKHISKERGETDVGLYINSATNKGESALHYASKLSEATSTNKNMHDAAREIAQLLLNSGASVYQQTKDTHETPFHYCAREGNNDILTEMLRRMTPVECQRALNKQSAKGWSPLLIACHKGHKDVVKTLLENNARVDVFDNDGRSALHLAAEHGYQDICGMLLKHKAFINAKSRIGYTALHLAATKGYTKLCLFLIQEHNAYVDVVTLKKQTPLHLAAETGQIEVCRLLMGLRANPDAADEKGQKPIHLAAQNNHGDAIKLFLKSQPALVSSSTKDGSTCAHLAAMQGSVSVLEELMKFDKQGVISARNRSTDATALQLAAEGGHSELVKALLEAGASATDENRAGYAAVHLASKNGHTNVIDSLRNAETDAISLSSRKLGLTALHIAAYFGQTETVRELLTYIPATTMSDPPISLGSSFLKELGTESGLTPLHLAAYSGEENVVRLLLNSQGVQVDAPSANLGFNPLHLACRGGHQSVVGLLLSRSSELLESKDNEGRTGLHIASVYGHHPMVEILLGQGAEIDSTDKENWTPLHCAAKAGYIEVVKLLVESSASPLAKTAKGLYPIWYAASENHNNVLSYLMKTEHDSYGLLDDREFVYNLTVCGKNNNNEPINEFVLSSPAPVDIAAKLSNILAGLSTREKERAKDLIAASRHCESMAAELLALAAGSESAGKLLRSVDRRSIQFLDILIENEQKEVIAHSAVQRYLQELWVGGLGWASWKKLLLFTSFIFCPIIWIIFSLPLGHRFHKIPIIKFMSYLTSHIYLMVLLCLTSITPIYPIIRSRLFPYWYEWILLAWLLGLIISEVTNPSDKAGLGWIKVAVLIFSIFAIVVHGVGYFVGKQWLGHTFYFRNQLFAVALLLACVQILDFLSFHYLFGPWAIIIGNLMKDLARFLAVLAIFMVGFSMVMASLNQPFWARSAEFNITNTRPTITQGLPSGVLITPLDTLELLFFALFGQTMPEDMKFEPAQPKWTLFLFKLFFGIYLLVTVIVLINLLIAMMSDTYQRIQAQSDIEWKFGLAKLIRNMHRNSTTPSPINIFTSWLIWLIRQCRKKREPFNPLKWERKGAPAGSGRGNIFQFGKPTPKQRWKTVFNKTKLTPRVSDIMRLSVAQVSPMTPGSPLHPLGSTMSVHHQQRIETVADWNLISKKYRVLVGREEPAPPDHSPENNEQQAQGSTLNLPATNI